MSARLHRRVYFFKNHLPACNFKIALSVLLVPVFGWDSGDGLKRDNNLREELFYD